MVQNSKICICQADKGGSTLIVPPSLLQQKIEEKVMDPNIYVQLDKNPSQDCYNKLIDLWRYAKANNFVSVQEAKEIVGITEKNNKSTASRFKPGRTYFVPSLKIHKLKPEELVPGVDIPARLITCLQQGVTKRSDVYLVEKWLKSLERDYCEDLVTDTTDTLIWLENCDKRAKSTSKNFTPFTFDFDSFIRFY